VAANDGSRSRETSATLEIVAGQIAFAARDALAGPAKSVCSWVQKVAAGYEYRQC
jgi:hypothetical protein